MNTEKQTDINAHITAIWREVYVWQRRAGIWFAIALLGWLAFFTALFCAVTF